MKKIFSFLALALAFTACQNEPMEIVSNNDLADVVLTVDAPELGATRADNDADFGKNSAFGAIDFFNEADWANYDLRYILEVYDANDDGNGEPIYRERLVNYLDKYAPTTFELRLVPNREYKFVVFADFVAEGENEDLYYDTTNLNAITAITDAEGWNAMNEARDAYFVTENVNVTTGLNKTLTLTRPFGKLRVIATDLDYIAGYSTPGYVKVNYHTEKVYKSFNAVNGQLNAVEMTGEELNYAYGVDKNAPYSEGYDANEANQTLLADYLLAVEDQQIPVNFTMQVYESEGGRLIKETNFNTQIPIQRNHLTTIIGDLLTTQANIKITIDDQFADEIVVTNIWDGSNLALPAANAEGWIEINKPGQFATLVANGGNNLKVRLTDDLNFDGYTLNTASEWLRGLTIDGNNKVITNFNLGATTRAAAGQTTALFPVVVGANIYDLTITNAYVDAGEGENAYAAALIGRSYGAVELSNVVVKNSTIKGTNKIGGLVGSVMENKIIANECGVDGVTIETYDVEDESGLAGGLIGYIACSGDSVTAESIIEKCFVRNTTFNVINSRGNEARSNSEFIGGIGGDKGDVLRINGAQFLNNTWNETGAEEYESAYGKYVGGSRGAFVVYVDGLKFGKLEMPEVATEVKGNTITLTWAAIEGAEKYNVTVDSDIVIVEGTTYTFTGEYETEYTFSVVALPANEEVNTVSDAAVVTATTEAKVVLATPEVKATVEANVVTLTWEAIEGAAYYTVQVDDDIAEKVEATSYVFNGDYEGEYIFTVVACPEDPANVDPSVACVVEAKTGASVKEVTVAEFLAAAEDTQMYQLKGVITSVANTTYGNFYLKDSTGEVLIYGLCSPEGEQKYWAKSGAKVGDTITVQTVRSSHNGAPQGKNALFVELKPFVAEASEWGVVGDLNNWGGTADVVMYNTWHTENLFVAYNVEITSGAIKVRANNAWNDAKNYGLEVAGNIYADKYYTVITGSGSQNATPMVYGTYDVYFDLTNKRIALMTPGKAYSEAADGGKPVVVVAGLRDHEWGLVGSFNGWDVANYVVTEVDGDWAVAKNVTLEKNAEFKFAADKAWTLSYGTGGEVNVGATYTTYKNGGNMKFVGEAGTYSVYFSLIDGSVYMEEYVAKAEYTGTLTFDDKAKRTTFSTTQQVWEDNGITMTNDKATSTNAVADYSKPARFYQGSKLTLTADGGEISKIVFDCNSSSYATALKNSIGSGATVSSDKVTVELDGATEFVVAKLTAQVRMDAVTVTYVK